MTTSDLNGEIEGQNRLESDQHLFEMFLNDHIENQVKRMMDFGDDRSDSLSN